MENNEPKEIVLTISIVGNDIDVKGPIKNEPLALWMLEKAKDIIKAHNILANQPVIEKPGGMINFVRNRLK